MTEKEKLKEKLERMLAEKRERNVIVAVMYYWLFTNDLLMGQVLEAVDGLRHVPTLYRHRVKQLCGEAERERLRYERELNRVTLSRAEFYADANERIANDVEHDLQVLYWSIKQVMDWRCVEHSAVVARVLMAQGLAAYACNAYDDDWQQLRRMNPVFGRVSLPALRPTRLLCLLGRLVAELKLEPDMMDSERAAQCIRQAVLAFNNRLRDPEVLARAIKVESGELRRES